MQWRRRRHDSASSTLAIWNAGTSSQCSDRPLCDNRSKKDWKGTPLQTSAVESAFFLKIWVLFICSSANYRLMYINYYNLLYQRLLSTNLTVTQSTQRFLWTHSVLLACFTGPLAIQYIPRMCDSENSRSIGKENPRLFWLYLLKSCLGATRVVLLGVYKGTTVVEQDWSWY